jgi:hypothetical protein
MGHPGLPELKAKLKGNDDDASPCIKLFLIGKMSDKFLPTQILL